MLKTSAVGALLKQARDENHATINDFWLVVALTRTERSGIPIHHRVSCAFGRFISEGRFVLG